jgi:cyclic pyranopterin phosphate synthase
VSGEILSGADSDGGGVVDGSTLLRDSSGRVARKLRLQVTDRCNFSCDFCMSPTPVWLEHKDVLTFEETARISRILAGLGIRKIRLSGGEPLVRRDIEKLVKQLTAIPGIESVSITTNGSLLKEKAETLKENGLSGVTVSVHSLRPVRYGEITGTRDMLPRVLAGIQKAKAVGLSPLKVNCVIKRDQNEDEIAEYVRFAREEGICVRFIEYMPFDGTRFWDIGSVLSGKEIIKRVRAVCDVVPNPREPGETAQTYGFADGGKGEIGVITSITEPFCDGCDRIRLTADGKMIPCLFSTKEFDVRSLLRGGAADDAISSFIQEGFQLKSEGVKSMIGRNEKLERVRPMYTVGG